MDYKHSMKCALRHRSALDRHLAVSDDQPPPPQDEHHATDTRQSSSINMRKVLWACAEFEVAFEREDWGSGFKATDSAEFLALNPMP